MFSLRMIRRHFVRLSRFDAAFLENFSADKHTIFGNAIKGVQLNFFEYEIRLEIKFRMKIALHRYCCLSK